MKLFKFLWIPVVTVLLLVLVLNGYIYFNQDNLIFAKEKINTKKVRPYGSHFEDVYLDMDDGSKFKCWFVKTKDHEKKPVFLYYLGKGGYIEKYVKLFDMIVQRVDVSIFSCSNRGCGTNEGTPSEEQLYKDALVSFNYLKGKNTKQLFIFGNSMGGAVALETASRHQKDIYGVILENTFLSMKKISEETHPFLNFFLISFDTLIRTKMDNMEKIKKIHIPLLINISEQDEVVPPEHSKILFELSPSKHKFKYLSKKGTHNNIIKVDDGSYHASLKKFVQTAISVREGKEIPEIERPPPAAAV
ncbi:conserved Plasmodium protein, unknown function [Plasmodium knowlesi strain H]|uniref:Serine aminopeptidase S33 domain-containing protein n=3 Tax=Plasmodium knowlesi TaxID=5850 RepID=A0A5K1U1Q2_PLAKH|nr:BEM46-like protein, putative [Plasmodium knowlesi strain H]OTN68133.1 Uncharacterized protein PKNOH_S04353500 [Plasmodium knowlesi]CAA9986900.1 BEM46-like protein, putative [Plasmodium knowlesi strain H]SBO26543.1 conserved Plasmodium protein, unknown function [Plasmodium knowlesi strain H]SBO28104.1 conserved Plasmodium protein, unknown function [Plasmodium knowlesi strain H]VVS76374.1 BEM46-like protein, putative [Plasmodium knowlesi strain H]|eukprot:XP_002258145.1 hypothetical protein, conserved in Plasmodium species [Plasmodium knowlesi strain H]